MKSLNCNHKQCQFKLQSLDTAIKQLEFPKPGHGVEFLSGNSMSYFQMATCLLDYKIKVSFHGMSALLLISDNSWTVEKDEVKI